MTKVSLRTWKVKWPLRILKRGFVTKIDFWILYLQYIPVCIQLPYPFWERISCLKKTVHHLCQCNEFNVIFFTTFETFCLKLLALTDLIMSARKHRRRRTAEVLGDEKRGLALCECVLPAWLPCLTKHTLNRANTWQLASYFCPGLPSSIVSHVRTNRSKSCIAS